MLELLSFVGVGVVHCFKSYVGAPFIVLWVNLMLDEFMYFNFRCGWSLKLDLVGI
jgi:hypothetical protein